MDKGFKTKILNNLWDENFMLNLCKECRLFRPKIIRGMFHLDCVFFNKCIRQYPYIIDNRRFK